jgi:hypothetical protein
MFFGGRSVLQQNPKKVATAKILVTKETQIPGLRTIPLDKDANSDTI